MKIAVCLFGQPRDYMRGYNLIKKFIEGQHKNIVFEFFYHCWLIQPNEVPLTFNDRPEDVTYNTYNPEIVHKLNSLYKPVGFIAEPSMTNFEEIKYKDSQIFKNSNEGLKSKVPAVLSQHYSRNKVRNLLAEHNCTYDCVIITRFDTDKTLEIDLLSSDTTKIYAADDAPHRTTYAPDHFIVCPYNQFLIWFDLYENLNNVLYSDKVVEKFNKYREVYHITPETLMMSWYYYNDFDLTREIVFKKNEV